MSRECPKESTKGKMTCYNCQGEGHISRDCPDGGSGGGRGRGGQLNFYYYNDELEWTVVFKFVG